MIDISYEVTLEGWLWDTINMGLLCKIHMIGKSILGSYVGLIGSSREQNTKIDPYYMWSCVIIRNIKEDDDLLMHVSLFFTNIIYYDESFETRESELKQSTSSKKDDQRSI